MSVWISIFALLFSILTYINTRKIRNRIEETPPGYWATFWTSSGHIVRNAVIALAVVFYFMNYASPGTKNSFVRAASSSVHMLQHVLSGKGLPQPDPGLISIEHMWFSTRLILFALVFSMLIGMLLALAEFRVQSRIGRGVIHAFTIALESLPDSIYIIVTVVVVLYVWFTFGINIPAFGSWNPGFKETLIPALIVSLPPAFYLNRVILMRAAAEQDAAYMQTATAKGATSRRVFYVHLVPNILPTLLKQIPVLAFMILSSVLFAETFMQYNGQLGRFTEALAMNMATGTENYINWTPEYHPLGVFGIGALLVILWMLIRLMSDLISKFTGRVDVPVSSGRSGYTRPQWTYIAVGGALLIIVLLLGAFPQLLTHYNPTAENLGSSNTAMPPFPPSAKHPFGTDTFGRDLLSQVLHGTFPSLMPVCLITMIVTVCSLILCVFAVANPGGGLSRWTKNISETMTAIPVLFILILAMYQRDTSSMHEELHFILWIVILELGRGAFSFYQTVDSWYSIAFVEGALAVGRSRLSILFTHLRSWLSRYVIEFIFVEFVRIGALMAQLAAFHIYAVERIGLLPFKPFGAIQWPEGIVSGGLSWFGMLGGTTMDLSYLSYPFFLYGPILALAITLIGANLIARGLRGNVTLLQR